MVNDSKQTILLTAEGLEDLKREYHTLSEKKRPKLVDRITFAREQGDLSENSDYTAAKEDLAFIDGRISELEDILKSAKVLPKITGIKQKVDMGCKVMVVVNGKKETFVIVGEWEANPLLQKISHTSPLGKSLLGKKVGDLVEVQAPIGKVTYKILKIE